MATRPEKFDSEAELMNETKKPFHWEAKSDVIREVESSINAALLVWGDDDPVVRKILMTCRGNLRQHLEGART